MRQGRRCKGPPSPSAAQNPAPAAPVGLGTAASLRLGSARGLGCGLPAPIGPSGRLTADLRGQTDRRPTAAGTPAVGRGSVRPAPIA
ncbi:MAG: hypothetical protein ACK55I_36605, partial [bacterium]